MGTNKTAGVSFDRAGWSKHTLCEMVDHIEHHFHQYMREALPRLLEMIKKAQSKAPDETTKTLKSLSHLAALLTEVYEPHVLKEEQMLFPYIRKLEAYAKSQEKDPGIKLTNDFIFSSMGAIDNEHDQIIDMLTQMKSQEVLDQLNRNTPESLQYIRELIMELTHDLDHHTKVEDRILFPRALELEKQLGIGN